MWNDKESDVDLLGHEKLARTVIEIIESNHLRPLTIGIYGDWGVGKSSILSILQQQIKDLTKTRVLNTHCITFNGWLFQGYEDAKSALMATVVSELAALQPSNKKIQKLASSLIKRVNWLKVAKVSAGAAFTALTGIPDPGILGGLVGLLKKGKNLLGNKQEDGQLNVEVNTEDDSFIKEYEEETITGQISAFRKEFAKLIKTSKVDHIVVLVDDLDRCLPKSVIDTLEAIRLFLFVEGTTFVISADEKMIEYSVRTHFPNLPASYSDYTKSYLEKLIQIPIRIPLLNQLQTGNYIKFLLLQNYLKHDYNKLVEVYNHFDTKKNKPYDPVELSYDIITEVLNERNDDLSEAILVGNHLTPTLSSGLKGNPRNIKRFLNTLFLRLRVARIYGLERDIKLNVLAKLMVLERFQSDKYESIINEVSVISDGISQTIKVAEEKKSQEAAVEHEQPVLARVAPYMEEKNAQDFENWIKISPNLGDINLHPYIFISREKAIGFDIDSGVSDSLQKLLASLLSGSQITLNSLNAELESLSPLDVNLLFAKLETESRATNAVKDQPNAMKGLFAIVNKHHQFEARLVQIVGSYPVAGLGAWAVSEFSGLKTPEGKQALSGLLQKFSLQSENSTLKKLSDLFLQNQTQ